MPHTITDFWRMVWYVNAPIIVMVTKLKERNRVSGHNVNYLIALYDIFVELY